MVRDPRWVIEASSTFWFVQHHTPPPKSHKLTLSCQTVCMEVVSPKLNTTMHITSTLSDFWEAMRVHFNPQRDISCGGHVHVTPMSLNNKFSLRSLKKIAFATVVYEDFVATMLPQARRENKYCQANSQSIDSGLHETLLWGKNPNTLYRVAAEIKACANETALYIYMQGNRYVLWNFQNIFPHPKTGRCTGTVEFRGGNQFLNTKGTLAWVAFVLGFITLAVQEVGYPQTSSYHETPLRILTGYALQDLLHTFNSSMYVPTTDSAYEKAITEWWRRVRRAARKSRLSRHLPNEYTAMATK